MQKGNNDSVQSAGNLIKQKIAELGINQAELAARIGEHYQTVSAIIREKREVTLQQSVKIDDALGFPPGTVALTQTRYQVAITIEDQKRACISKKRQLILERIKKNGGFWSYQGVPEGLEDDIVIEAALVHLDLEDLPLLFGLWSKSHIKRVWKERLVSQGKRLNVLNYILAVKMFHISNPDQYITRYARAQ